MSENENDLLPESAIESIQKAILLALEHDLKHPITAIRNRISQLERYSETNPTMNNAFSEIHYWLTEMEHQLSISRIFLSDDIILNMQKADVTSIINNAIKQVKHNTDEKTIFYRVNYAHSSSILIDPFYFRLAIICVLNYLTDDENNVPSKKTIEVSFEKTHSDFDVIRFHSFPQNQSEYDERFFTFQTEKNLFRLEIAKRILSAHSGSLKIEKPFQSVAIYLPHFAPSGKFP